ncbi:MAG TPA: ADOP family duplicated permease [Gemmatimonadaceae bacterium]|nr:ADOP family duplicated permease [Gemmatimonadaceae bacterium]
MRVRLKHRALLDLIAGSALSQNHWALKLGLSRGHWSEIVNGKHPFPSARTRIRMLEAFGVGVHELFQVESGSEPWADLDFRRAIADRYTIDRELGQGGMGGVYLARDARHGRTVAIKVISPEIVSGIGLDQFQREISTVARLTHPNILPLFDSGDAAGQPFYVMPWIRGGSLRARLETHSRLGIADVVALTTRIANALDHAHHEGVLHCDVKPENVLLFDDHPFVMDFGIARKLRAEVDEWSFRSEMDLSAGTPAYVSPEQALGEKNLDGRSDIYSLACMTWEMLAGRPAFTGNTTQAIVTRRFLVPPPPIQEFAPELPAAVSSVLERAMAVPREQRPPNPVVFTRELKEAAHGTSRVFAGASLAVSRTVGRIRRPGRQPTMGGVGIMLQLLSDIRVAFRSLRRSPGFALAVIATLGIALGANGAMFGIADRLFFSEPAHIVAPQQVHRVLVARWQQSGFFPRSPAMSYAAFADFRDRTTSFSHVAGASDAELSLGSGANARVVATVYASGQYFPLLGVRPARGRFFGDAEDRLPAGSNVAVVSHQLWQNVFGGADSVIGARIRLNESPFEVIGVAPAGFTGTGLAPLDIWLPMMTMSTLEGMPPGWHEQRGGQYIETIARLKPGVSRGAAEQDVRRVYQLSHAHLSPFHAKAVSSLGALVAGRERDSNSAEPRVAAWLFFMALVLLAIACANVANLMLARGISRRPEFAVRRALGAGERRLVRQLFTESVLVTAMGLVAGLLLMRVAGTVTRSFLLPGVEWSGNFTTMRVLLVTVTCTVLAALGAALLPLWSATRADLSQALRAGARNIAARPLVALQTFLLVQTTLATTLLIVGALFVRSLDQVRKLDLGFNPKGLMYARPNLPARETTVIPQLHLEAVRRLTALPDVESVGLLHGGPFLSTISVNVNAPGLDSMPRLPGGGPYIYTATAGTLRALEVRLLQGRLWTDADLDSASQPTVIITKQMADAVWPGQDPLQKCLIVSQRACAPVVGVIANFRRQNLREQPFMAFFWPMGVGGDIPPGSPQILVRMRGDVRRAEPVIRRVLLDIDPSQPYATIVPYEQWVDPKARSWRLGASVLTAFGALSLLLAAVGVYSVVSYVVASRTREIGVRAALGASPGDVMRTVIWRGMVASVAGVAAGSALALAMGTRIESLLFNTSGRDPVAFAVSTGAVIVVALLATVLPGIRAARVDPLIALRAD